MKHRPNSLVGADLEGALQMERRDTVLATYKLPAGSKPYREGRPSSVEDGSCGDRATVATGVALETAVPEPPSSAIATGGALESVRPAKPLEVVEAVSVRAEPCVECPSRSGVIRASTGGRSSCKATFAPVKWIPPTLVQPAGWMGCLPFLRPRKAYPWAHMLYNHATAQTTT